MTTTIVTGASGQLGAHLANRLLADGARVRVILRDGSTHPLLRDREMDVVRGSFGDVAVLRDALAGCDSVFHVAGAVSYDPADDADVYRTNVDATVALVDAAAEHGVKDFVLTSSTMAVGVTDDAPAREVDDFPADLYSIAYADSKRIGERYVLAAAARGMRCVSVCPSTITGYGERLGNFRRMFSLARRGRLRLAPPGGLGVVDVDDAVDAHIRAWKQAVSGRRYIACAENVSLVELFDSVNRAVGNDTAVLPVPAGAFGAARAAARIGAVLGLPVESLRRSLWLGMSVRHYDASRAHDELGWAPARSLDESMRRAAQWFAQG